MHRRTAWRVYKWKINSPSPVTADVTPRKLMSDSENYTPLSERLQQDVWHDNFVPKYSALATARPSRLVLIGVWLIFSPAALSAIVVGLSTFSDLRDSAATVISSFFAILIFVLAVAILFTQTRRYLMAKRQDNDVESDDGSDL